MLAITENCEDKSNFLRGSEVTPTYHALMVMCGACLLVLVCLWIGLLLGKIIDVIKGRK